MTTTELVLPDALVDLRTGEIVPATPSKAVELLGVARTMRAQILDLVKDCEAVLLEESRRQGTKTLHLPNGTAEVSGGTALEWDIDVLAELQAVGLPEDRYGELVVTTVTQKVDARVAKQLEAANPEYAAIIERARRYEPRPWRVSIK
jgi:hypothetical protein